MKKTPFLIYLIFSCINLGIAQSTTLIPFGASWKYLDNGSNQGTVWKEAGYNDGTWKTGTAKLGYGNGDESTVVSFGPSKSAKYITTYFRKSLSITNLSSYSGFTLSVKRDDGIIVYVNGVERYRNNMPLGSISSNTLASSSCSDDGTKILTASIPSSAFVSGTNIIGVEIHQAQAASTDITFDLQLSGTLTSTTSRPNLLRGPYLQIGTSSSIIVKWRTNVATNSEVKFGTVAGALTSTVKTNSLVTEHEVKLAGLAANTKYYYSIGSTGTTLQGDVNNYFITAPAPGSNKKVRLWVSGDCGNNSTNQKNVRDKYISYMGSDYTDAILLLGDNAYSKGYDNEYQTGFFDIYKDKLLKQSVVWPSPGNHDYAGNSLRQVDHQIPYFDIFSLPSKGEAGGVPSNTESFYSFNYGNIHFISLDSYGKDDTKRLYDTLGTQATWLKKDLEAKTQKWTIVYFHHPPYTMGSHNSDTESELIKVRQNLLNILERYKVDLVLCGHSHGYERSKLIKGHYGTEATFNPSEHNVSNSSGKYNGTSLSCPYIKNSSSSNEGTVYVVAGSSGAVGGTQASWPHKAMYYSNASNGGAMSIEIEDNRLDAKFICADGQIRDNFTIFKDINKTTNLSIVKGQSANLKASWVGEYTWSTGETTRSITVTPGASTSYIVKDKYNCVTDVFNVTVTLSGRIVEESESSLALAMTVFPNPIENSATIKFTLQKSGVVTLTLFDALGNNLKTLLSEKRGLGIHSYQFSPHTDKIPAGIYFLKLELEGKQIVQRISIGK